MPIVVHADLQRPSEKEFAKLAYESMAFIFGVRNKFGTFFSECIYKQEIERLMDNALIEVPIDVTYENFKKRYLIDVLISKAAPMELKVVETLGPRHRAQLLNYLLLCELFHGMLVNLRPDRVKHEYVNTTLTRDDRTCFDVIDEHWTAITDTDIGWRKWITSALRDWGTGLDVNLYLEGITHVLGGEEKVVREISVHSGDKFLGKQIAHTTDPSTVLRVTTLKKGMAKFEESAYRYLDHTDMTAMQWVNISLKQVRFKTLMKGAQKT